MGDEVSGFWERQNRKRSYEQMEDRRMSGHDRPSRSQHEPQLSNTAMPPVSTLSSHARGSHEAAPETPSAQYSRRAFDLRRPMPQSGRSTLQVIDLTDETSEFQTSGDSTIQPPLSFSSRASRPPRYDREIIDLSAESPQTYEPQNSAGSPDVQFVLSRPLPPTRHQRDEDAPVEAGWGDDGFEILQIINRHGAGRGGDPVASREIGRQRRRPEITALTPFILRRGATAGVQGARHTVHRLSRQLDEGLDDIIALTNNFAHPNLDFTAVGFHLHEEPQEPATPTYSAPPEAPKGFTRSPAENEVLVCPNCEDELCVGDSDVKRQAWVLKACGHVYCGECTVGRSKSRRKGKEPVHFTSKPFKTCVIDGCGKRCTGRSAMFQLFL